MALVEMAPLRLSVVHGAADKPLLDFTLSEILDFQAQRYGQAECLVIPWTGSRWTYERVQHESRRLAKALLAQGIKPGDRCAVMAGNCEQYVAVFFACTRVGAILVILNNTYTSQEAQYALAFTNARILFTTTSIGPQSNRKLLCELDASPKVLERIVILRGDVGNFTSYEDFNTLGVRVSDDTLNATSSSISPHDVCNLQFTSGTTGHPKAAMLTHFSLVNNSRFIGDRMALGIDDVLCCPPPIFHCFGLVLGLLAVITHGSKIVYPSETFDPAACLRAISDEQCTAIHGVPAMFDSIFSLPRPENFDCRRLRTGIIAGAPVPRHLMELMVNNLGMTEFTSSYGLTEASPTCFNAFHDSSIDLKLSTVGHVMPHAHAKIVDRNGNIVPIGVRGELCMAGYQLQKGYWSNREKTQEVMIRDDDGVLWLHTGDEAVFHEDSTCTITGRFKDVIIRGGENIYPLEIEERLVEHSSIERAIVVGVSNHKYGQVVGAFLQKASLSKDRLSNPEIQDWVRLRLGRHKAPLYVFWLGEDGISSEVPLTGSGKVKKYELARLAEELVVNRRARL